MEGHVHGVKPSPAGAGMAWACPAPWMEHDSVWTFRAYQSSSADVLLLDIFTHSSALSQLVALGGHSCLSVSVPVSALFPSTELVIPLRE